MGLSNFFQSNRLPAGVGAWMSTRAGGLSPAPYDSLNLGEHVGDVPAHVAANRTRLASATGATPVFLQQVHGIQVQELRDAPPLGATPAQADACYTSRPGLACTIMVADCLPVLLWDTHGRWVGAAHAGWRGLAGQGGEGVLEALWACLQAQGAQTQHTQVWLGPCIGPQAFEVGPEVLQAFAADGLLPPHGAFVPKGPGRLDGNERWLANLPALARARLQRLGLHQISGNDGTPPWCTVSQPGLFFSHRRDAARLGSTGRMAACIWLG